MWRACLITQIHYEQSPFIVLGDWSTERWRLTCFARFNSHVDSSVVSVWLTLWFTLHKTALFWWICYSFVSQTVRHWGDRNLGMTCLRKSTRDGFKVKVLHNNWNYPFKNWSSFVSQTISLYFYNTPLLIFLRITFCTDRLRTLTLVMKMNSRRFSCNGQLIICPPRTRGDFWWIIHYLTEKEWSVCKHCSTWLILLITVLYCQSGLKITQKTLSSRTELFEFAVDCEQWTSLLLKHCWIGSDCI